jgi:hypothetical protein
MGKAFNYLIFIGIMAIAFSSCKTYRNVENLGPSTPNEDRFDYFDEQSLDKLQAGDKILIRTKDRRALFVSFEMVKADSLIGTLTRSGSVKFEKNTPFQISTADIESLKVKRVSAGATFGLVGGSIVAVVLLRHLAFISFVSMFSSGW